MLSRWITLSLLKLIDCLASLLSMKSSIGKTDRGFFFSFLISFFFLRFLVTFCKWEKREMYFADRDKYERKQVCFCWTHWRAELQKYYEGSFFSSKTGLESARTTLFSLFYFFFLFTYDILICERHAFQTHMYVRRATYTVQQRRTWAYRPKTRRRSLRVGV